MGVVLLFVVIGLAFINNGFPLLGSVLFAIGLLLFAYHKKHHDQ